MPLAGGGGDGEGDWSLVEKVAAPLVPARSEGGGCSLSYWIMQVEAPRLLEDHFATSPAAHRLHSSLREGHFPSPSVATKTKAATRRSAAGGGGGGGGGGGTPLGGGSASADGDVVAGAGRAAARLAARLDALLSPAT